MNFEALSVYLAQNFNLSQKEITLVEAVYQGMSLSEMAERANAVMFIDADETLIASHLETIYERLNVDGRVSLRQKLNREVI